MIALATGFIIFYETVVVTNDDQWKTALAVAKDLSSPSSLLLNWQG